MAIDLAESLRGCHKRHAVGLRICKEALAVHADQVLVVPPGIGARNLVGLVPGHTGHIHDQLGGLFPPEIMPPPSSSWWS